jgi:hypothetical protein
MRKALALPLATAALICVSATLAAADTITLSPGGAIVASIRGLGFEGTVISLFACNVTLTGTLARGPIRLAGRIGSISEVRTSECSGGHTAVASGLPWALTGQTALACPSESTGLLATAPATFTLDGVLTGTGSMGVLFASAANAFVVLFSRLSNGVVILGRSGIYTQVQIFSCE